MKLEYVSTGGGGIALISADSPVITDAQSALEVAMTVRFEGNVSKIALPKGALCEEFFVLSTGIAGEILQKWINYHIKAAIYGDFSRYTSKPLKDFIHESNQGKDVFFPPPKRRPWPDWLRRPEPPSPAVPMLSPAPRAHGTGPGTGT